MLAGIDYYEVSSLVRHKQNVYVCHRIQPTTRTVILKYSDKTKLNRFYSSPGPQTWLCQVLSQAAPSYRWSLTIDRLLMMRLSTCTEGNNKLVSLYPQTTSCKFKNVKSSLLWTCLRRRCFPSTAQRPSVNLRVCYCVPLSKLISFSHFEFL